MKKDWCKKSVALFMAISFLLPSFFFLQTKKAEAQASTEIFGSTLGPIAGAVASGIASCTGIGEKIKNFISESFGTVIQSIENPTSVPIDVTGKTRGDIDTLQTKETCYDAIFYSIASAALRLTTHELLSWINSGFDGYPFYRDSGSYFNELWENEVNSFSTSLVNLDESLYPWAKASAERILLAHQAKFENYARYTLNEFVVGGADTYRASFVAGGWGAWEAMLLPQNNPVGFRFLTEQELNRRTGAGTQYSISPKDRPQWASIIDEWKSSSAFFSSKICIAPTTITTLNEDTLEEEEYVIKGKTMINLAQKHIPAQACERWENVTPGQAVASSLEISLGTNTRQKELADEMNESIAVVFDALVNQLVTKGVQSLTEECGALDSDPNCPQNQ